MAIAAASKTTGGSTTNNVQTITTSSTTPVSGALYFYILTVYRDDSIQPPNPTVTGTNGYSGTWTQTGKFDFDTGATTMGTVFVYQSQAVSGVAGTVSANFGSGVIDANVFSLIEVTGHDTTTPVPQVGTGDNDQTSPEAFVSLGALVNSDSRVFGVRAKNSNTVTVYTVETNWAKLTEGAQSTPSTHQTVGWSNTAGADPNSSWTHALGGLVTGGFLWEVAAAAAGGATDSPTFHQAGRSIYPGPSTL